MIDDNRTRTKLILSAVILIACVVGAGMYVNNSTRIHAQETQQQRYRAYRAETVTTPPLVQSKIKDLEIVNVKLVNQGTPRAAVEIEVRNKYDHAVTSLNFGWGDATTSGGQGAVLDPERPEIVAIPPHSTKTFNVYLNKLFEGYTIFLDAAIFGDGREDGDKRSLEGMRPKHPYDITVRDDKDPSMVSFQTKTGAYAVDDCDVFGFGSANSKIETTGCTTLITFDLTWRADFSFHPRHKCDETVTIKAGDVLHGVFTIDTCSKTSTGTIRNETQNYDLMNVADTNITDSKGVCSSPPPC